MQVLYNRSIHPRSCKKKKKIIKKFSSTNEIFFFLNFIKKSRIKKNPKNKQTAKKD